MEVSFRGHRYTGYDAVVRPVPGEILGEALLPACNDTNAADPVGDERIKVARIPGVDPDVAVVWGTETILVVEGTGAPLPETISRYLERPTCDPSDEPIELSGTWLGILGADGNTEVDLDPPYDVEMYAASSSAATYARAELSVRVPVSLGRPISSDDVRNSLWEGGRIEVTATGDGDGFVARNVAAFSP
jgi:Family of unknown function (DUF6281)